MAISEERKIIARTLLNGFGGTPQVFAFQDEKQKTNIDLLSCVNRPQEGVTSYATIGLFEHSIGYEIEEKELRMELLGICRTDEESFPNMLVTCAFHMIHSQEIASYGAVFTDIVAMYKPESELKHMLFLPPQGWNHVFEAVELGNRLVTWLQAVPITEAEKRFLDEHEVEELEELFANQAVDFSSFDRKSVV